MLNVRTDTTPEIQNARRVRQTAACVEGTDRPFDQGVEERAAMLPAIGLERARFRPLPVPTRYALELEEAIFGRVRVRLFRHVLRERAAYCDAISCCTMCCSSTGPCWYESWHAARAAVAASV